MEQAILQTIPHTARNGAQEPRLPNTTNIAFQGTQSADILMLLDQNGIFASSGSACSTVDPRPSHVLTAMGQDAKRARSSVRFSLDTSNTEAEVEQLMAVLPGIIAKLRETC